MPGPGDYRSPEPRPKNVAVIMGKREEKLSTNPGPGQYNQDDSIVKKSSASIRMTSTKRSKNMPGVDASESPGPGHFNAADGGWSGGHHFDKHERFEAIDESPGPGTYDA